MGLPVVESNLIFDTLAEHTEGEAEGDLNRYVLGGELGLAEDFLAEGDCDGDAIRLVGAFVGFVDGAVVEGHHANVSATVSTLHVLPRAFSATIESFSS